MLFAGTWMDLEIITVSDVKQKQTHRPRKKTYGYQRGEVVGRDKLPVWD